MDLMDKMSIFVQLHFEIRPERKTSQFQQLEERYSFIYKVSQLLLEQLEFHVYCHWTIVVTAPDKKGTSKG